MSYNQQIVPDYESAEVRSQFVDRNHKIEENENANATNISQNESEPELTKDGDEEQTLYQQIGGEEIIDKVVDTIYEEMAQDFNLKNVSKCSIKRKDLMKKQQKAFLIDLLGGPSNAPTENVRNASKRINASNFLFFLRVLKKAFQESGIEDHLVQQINNQIVDQVQQPQI